MTAHDWLFPIEDKHVRVRVTEIFESTDSVTVVFIDIPLHDKKIVPRSDLYHPSCPLNFTTLPPLKFLIRLPIELGGKVTEQLRNRFTHCTKGLCLYLEKVLEDESDVVADEPFSDVITCNVNFNLGREFLEGKI